MTRNLCLQANFFEEFGAEIVSCSLEYTYIYIHMHIVPHALQLEEIWVLNTAYKLFGSDRPQL